MVENRTANWWSAFPEAGPVNWWEEFPADNPAASDTAAAAEPVTGAVPYRYDGTDSRNDYLDLPLPGTFQPTPPEDDFTDQVIAATSRVAGMPVDFANTALGAAGLPVSDTPFLGSESIEDMVQAATGNRERREISALAPNLDQAASAPLDQRVYASFLNTPRALESYVTKQYGPEGQGWYRLKDIFGEPTSRIVVRNPDGTEMLFNPPGIDLGDVAGMAGAAPDLAGALAGAAASIPAYAAGPWAGIPASAVLSAGGAQVVGESVGRLFPENVEAEPDIMQDVVPRATNEALVDAILGVVTGGGSRALVGTKNAVSAPFAKSASEPMAVEYRSAADRLKAQGYDISPLPSEAGAGGFIPRVEGLLEKLPGSSEKMRQYREAGDRAIVEFQEDVGGGVDPASVGRSVASELETQRKNLVIDRETSLEGADRSIAQSEAGLLTRQGPQMSSEAAGSTAKAGYDRAREEFRAEASRLYQIARNAPGGSDPIVNFAPVRQQAQRIRDALPPAAEGGPDVQFTPDGLNRMLTGIDNLADNATIDQARQMRILIDQAIDDRGAMPGVPERYLTQLRDAVTRSIDESVARAGSPELRQALGAANAYYRENVDQFSRKGIVETYRDPTSGGFIEDNQIVARLLSGRGKPDVIRQTREMLGAGSPEWAAIRRSAMEQIFDTGRSKTLYGRRVVDVDGLVARLNQLDDETVRELFGVSDAQQLRNLAADISNRSKYLDAASLSDLGSGSVLQQLRAAAAADDQIAREYRNNVIAPFLRSEAGVAAKINPEELVPWLYRKAAPDDAAAVIGRLPADMRQAVERGVVADIIENSISRGNRDLASVRRLVTSEAGPAEASGIAELLGVAQDAAGRQQSRRISILLSPESRQALRDLALITARRQERDATSSAIGGLAAGAAITGIMSRPVNALQAAAVARGLAELVTSPAVRKWLTNTRVKHMSPIEDATATAVGPTIMDAYGHAIAESADVQAALDWLAQSGDGGEPRQDGDAPPGFASWEEFFATSE